jgi:hypothetical protein
MEDDLFLENGNQPYENFYFYFYYRPINHFPDGRSKIQLFSEITNYPITLLLLKPVPGYSGSCQKLPEGAGGQRWKQIFFFLSTWRYEAKSFCQKA